MSSNADVISTINSVKEYLKISSIKAMNEIRPDVRKRFKRINQSSINKLVYKVYTPKKYIRRRNNKGLEDWTNMVFENSTKIFENTITDQIVFYNIADFNQKYTLQHGFLSDVIEFGVGDSKNSPIYANPRPFMEETKNKIIDDENLIFIYNFKKALKTILSKETNR